MHFFTDVAIDPVSRVKNAPFPVALVVTLVAVVAVGAFFIVKAVKKGRNK